MNMKLKNEFKQLLQFKNQEDKDEHDSKILMFKFLSIIEEEMKLREMSKKDLADLLGTSPSFITQLFRGTKTINLLKLAQLQNLFNIEFDIKLVSSPKRSKKPNSKAKVKLRSTNHKPKLSKIVQELKGSVKESTLEKSYKEILTDALIEKHL